MNATKEQQAFDTFWNSMDEHEGMDTEVCENVFKDGYIAGRKQALEEAIAINHKLAASPEDVSQVVFASVLNRKLLELLNE